MASDTTNYNIKAEPAWHGVEFRSVWDVLEEWGINNPTEDDVWEAVAELDGHKLDYYADGDLAEWL